MADLTRVDAAQAVEITDGLSLSVKVRTSTPTSIDEALVVREAARGQDTSANSIPVVLASDQSAILTNGNKVDDSAFTIGTDRVFSIGALADDTATDSVDEGDVGIVRMTLDRRLLVRDISNYTEDTAHVSGDIGTFILGVRNDSEAAMSSTNSDYTPISVDGAGRQYVRMSSVSAGLYAEDAAHASGASGTFILAVRNDTATTSFTSANGDYSPVAVDVNGRLFVQSQSSFVDDAAFTVATSRVNAMGALADDTATDSVDEGDVGIVRMTLDRKLLTRVVGATDTSRLDVTSSGEALAQINSSFVDDAAFTVATSRVNAIGALADETGTDSVDEGDVGIPRMTLDRKLLTRVVGATDNNRLDINASGQALVRDVSNYAEDTAHVSGDIGNFVLAVRNDAGTVLVGTDGDYIPLTTDSNGNLRVNLSSGLIKTDDSAFTIATDSVSPIGALADETSPDSVDEGDVGLVRMTLDRKLLTRVVGARDQDRLNIDYRGNALCSLGDSASLDGFGRLRVSEPFTIFDSKFVNGSLTNALFWDTSTATGGTETFVTNESTYNLQVTTTSGSSVTRQTRQYFSYQPGKSLMILITGVMGALKANVRQRIGYFETNNGIFFEQDGTNLKVVRRTFVSGSVVDNTVNQSSWNLDPLDGSGPSGITINMANTQIFLIDLQWLGVGRVRMGFVINGKIIYCHEFLTANVLTEVFMTTPNLPVRYEITNTGTSASNTTMKAICSTVLSESGYNPLGVIRSAITSTTAFSYNPAVGTYIPVISIRLKSTNIRALIQLLQVNLLITNNSDHFWRLEFNPTLTGPSWTSAGTNSLSEFDISATATTGGEVLYMSPNQGNTMIFNAPPDLLKVGASISGTSDIISLSITRNSESAASVRGFCSLIFRELI